jgi:UDP-glucose 4-epimerase
MIALLDLRAQFAGIKVELDAAVLETLASDQPQLVPLHQAERGVNPVPKRLADVSKARDLIGFEATHPLEEGIAELVAWWRSEAVFAEAAA